MELLGGGGNGMLKKGSTWVLRVLTDHGSACFWGMVIDEKELS